MTHSPRRGSTRRLLGYLRPYRLRFSLGLLTTALASLLDGVTLVILIPLLQQIFASAPPAGGGTKLETLVANVALAVVDRRFADGGDGTSGSAPAR